MSSQPTPPGDATPKHGEDRREAPRILAEQVHALIMEVEEDGIMVPGCLVPHDLSTAGVSGKWERPLPDADFTLHLELAGDVVDARARVAWQHPLPGGRVLAGVSFVSLGSPSRELLDSYLQALQIPSRRRSPRFSDILPVEVVGVDDSVTAIASDISAEGLQMTTDERLPECDELTLLVPLTWDVPLSLSAVVRWRRITQNGGQRAGLEFTHLSEYNRSRIEDYLRDLAS